MFTRNVGQIFVAAIALAAVCTAANAQKTVYKWVDEDGVVHFSDAPLDEWNPAETESLTTARPPPVAAQPVAKSPAAPAADDENQSQQPASEIPPLYQKTDTTKLSMAELDRRCDEAREKMIAPLRKAEIAKCKQDKRNEASWCEQFSADFGDGGLTDFGTIRPRMFDDLPECVEALQEENRRGG